MGWVGARTAAGIATAVALSALGATTAYAANTTPPTPPATTGTTTATQPGPGTSPDATATPGAAGEKTLSPTELADQIAQAKALTDDLTESNAGIAAAAGKLQRLAIQANTLLQEYAEARDAERTARDEANQAVAVYRQLSSQMGKDRKALGQWAYLAYAGTGGTISDLGSMIETLGKPAAEATDLAGQLSYLSNQRSGAFERVQNQTELQKAVAAKAVDASTRATEAAKAAKEAKEKLDTVIAEQKTQLEATRKLHAEQVSKAGPIAGLLLGSEDEDARKVTEKLRAALVVPGVAADGSVKACSTNDAEYPNGQIPAAGLCPLVGSPGDSLRPAAAAAFNAMSLAYRKDTGQTLCITDSYRSYAEQITVKAAKGKWAATPGYSEHGFGRAVDLCGGVENFGAPAHLWMKQNAPLYGWFHPAWAEPNGSLPEPWHWEYAG
ncbi:D-alanyl-D-alanine carboxypeptidase family protein [Knoellia koreensis]|uniref:D-alanyl-D-alanine carboxypeptidase-like core domain-containing protein n=1 Tax=Knoellia koreensis TaxID=2730921 RepID=A0A849HCC7_9MICO|nr:hypothetical protein [Knoellia sp. DB2414S]